MKKFFVFCITMTMVCTLINVNAQVNLSNGLIAWYPFNGNANDSSGNGHNGMVNNATPANNRFGKSNGAYYCNGDKKAISVLGFNQYNTNGITVSMWINTKKTTSAVQVIAGAIGSIYLNVHKIGSYTADFDNDLTNHTVANTSKCVVTSGKWVNITATCDGTTTRLYSNGVLERSFPEEISFRGSDLIIGNKAYEGYIDDVRIYSRAISADEVAAIYNLTY